MKHIRYTVLAFLDQMTHFDAYTVSKINERLPLVPEDFEKNYINHIREKAMKTI